MPPAPCPLEGNRKGPQAGPRIQILRGVECDILEDGSLDLSDDVLAEADWLLAVLHYGLRQPRDQIMKRLMTAIRSPHVDALGHLTGRMVGRREGVDLDLDATLKAAADHGTMIEINAHPNRLDIDDIGAAAARDLGIHRHRHRRPQRHGFRRDAVRRLSGPPRRPRSQRPVANTGRGRSSRS